MTEVTILHFNDVYQIAERDREPVGGAARFIGGLKALADEDPLILFSGDVFAPSLTSTVTRGVHMIPILNMCGIHAACFGNHDFDFGVEHLEGLAAQCSFPWLLTNVVDRDTGALLCGARSHVILDHGGVRFGFIGLVEYDWLVTLSTVDVDDVTFTDFVVEGRRWATILRDEHKVDVVIALTHMRTPNDTRLARECPEIDLILGGHDHIRWNDCVGSTRVIKSGTDFREFSRIRLLVPAVPSQASKVTTADAAPESISTNTLSSSSPSLSVGDRSSPTLAANGATMSASTSAPVLVTVPAAASRAIAAAQAAARPTVVDVRTVDITTSIPRYGPADDVVAEYEALVGARLDEVICFTDSPLDTRTEFLRTGEVGIGNFICDVMRYQFQADLSVLNSGTIRSDAVYGPGEIRLRDLLNILPMDDPIIKATITGRQIRAMLENGVSKYPAHEGRFPQISGVRFSFDPRRPPGDRVVDVFVDTMPVDDDREYSVVTKEYLLQGKDGYDALTACTIVVPADIGGSLQIMIQNHLRALAAVDSGQHQQFGRFIRKVVNTLRLMGSRNSSFSSLERLDDLLLGGHRHFAASDPHHLHPHHHPNQHPSGSSSSPSSSSSSFLLTIPTHGTLGGPRSPTSAAVPLRIDSTTAPSTPEHRGIPPSPPQPHLPLSSSPLAVGGGAGRSPPGSSTRVRTPGGSITSSGDGDSASHIRWIHRSGTSDPVPIAIINPLVDGRIKNIFPLHELK